MIGYQQFDTACFGEQLKDLRSKQSAMNWYPLAERHYTISPQQFGLNYGLHPLQSQFAPSTVSGDYPQKPTRSSCLPR